MAPELTYDPSPVDAAEFSPEEIDSIARGEEALQEQQQLLAGKYRDAEELEKAYIELQRKLGGREEPTAEPEEAEEAEQEEQQEEEEDQPISPAAELITNASQEYAENGTLSEETMQMFAEMNSTDLVQAYMEMQANAEQPAPVADLSPSDITTIKNLAGGDEGYSQLVSWASENLPQEYIQAFDSIIDSASLPAIQLAVAGLRSQFEMVNGYEGRMFSGKPAQTQADVFRSQAEVVRAMSDPRYDNDPAYRADVFEKLERSNLNY